MHPLTPNLHEMSDTDLNEKIKAVSKVFSVTRHLANAMMFGQSSPSPETLDNIAQILEVCPQWLSGETSRRKGYPERMASEEI